MAIDPTKFHRINVTDTCAVWNVLSSVRLYGASQEARCDFAITSYVRYECLTKPRKSISASEQILIDTLRREQQRGAFRPCSCDIGDLQAVRLLENRKRIGKGELSSIAFAMKTGQGFMTDDQKARQLAAESGHRLTQTTPHMLAWLIFNGFLGDSDVQTVVQQHTDAGRPLAVHLQRAYEMALQCKLNAGTRLATE